MNTQKPPAAPFTSRVRDILKKVDGLLKSEDLEGALAEIGTAKKAEPKNMYVHAYYERIQFLLDERKRHQDAESALRKTEDEARKRAEADRKEKLAEETKRKLEANIAQRTKPAAKINTTIQPAPPLPPRPHPIESSDNHVARETDFEVLVRTKVPKISPQIVVIDDDETLLAAIVDLLRDQGFSPQPFMKSDDAYKFLLHATPHLILADINLESSTMGGFAFFQKLQEIPRLAKVPFIFVSGLTDEIVVRTGKELGADDYLTKPFATQTLISIIKGKLRRYSEIFAVRGN